MKKKKILFVFVFILLSVCMVSKEDTKMLLSHKKKSLNPIVYDSNTFVTTWKTDASSENPTSITINFKYLGGTAHYFASWKCDGVYDIVYFANQTHDYGEAGTYNVCIKSDRTDLEFLGGGLTEGEKAKLLEVKQWGNIKWASFKDAFKGMTNMQITATDVPDLSGVTDMSGMFADATNFTGHSSMNSWKY